MSSKSFAHLWRQHFPKAYPVSHQLKWDFPERWFRIHSLPRSKRGADTAEDKEVVLQRQNQLIQDVVGEGGEVFLAFGKYTEDISNRFYDEVPAFAAFECVETLNMHQVAPRHYDEEGIVHFDVYAKKIEWRSGEWDDVLIRIDNDEIRMLIVSFVRNRIVSPYDGGVDVILSHPDEVSDFKEKYRDWLSSHPNEL